MKNKRLILVSCCAAAAFIGSPALAGMHKKSGGMSVSKPQQMVARTAHMSPNMSHAGRQVSMPTYNPNPSSPVAGTRQHTGTRYYGGNRYYYNNNAYYGVPYYGGGWGYPYYGSTSVWPYVAASFAPYVASSLFSPGYYNSYPYYGGYPNGGGYPYRYSYYGSGYGYGTSTVAAVQRRLGEMGYYHGVVDGVIGPRTRAAIATFETRHGLVVDGTVSRPLLNRLGLA